ncbi:hypothetical protein [Microcystis phage Mae-JY30]
MILEVTKAVAAGALILCAAAFAVWQAGVHG